MAEPQKNDPKKPAYDFLADRRGQSFDMDDDTPAVAPKATPPKTPQAPKPANRNYKPYTGMPGRPETDDEGFVDLPDLTGRSQDRDAHDPAFWGDDDDDMDDEDPLFNIADRLLPDRPEINVTLDNISNVGLTALIAAGIIEEEVRGKLSNHKTDTLTAAALLVEADNYDEITGELHSDTVSLVDAFNAAVANGTPDVAEFKTLPAQTQRLVIAFVTADLEQLHKGMNDGQIIPPEDDELAMVAEFLADASRHTADKENPADKALLQRAARVFNAVSHQLPLDIDLRPADRGFAVHNKNAIDAHEVKNLSKKGPKGPSTPK